MSAPQPAVRSSEIRSPLVLLGHTVVLGCSGHFPTSYILTKHSDSPMNVSSLLPLSLHYLPCPLLGIHLSNLPSASPLPTLTSASKSLQHHFKHYLVYIYHAIFPKSNSLFPKQSPPLVSIYIVGITIFKTSMSPLTLFFSGNTSIKLVSSVDGTITMALP